MDNGKSIYEVDVDTRLSRMKPVHACWVISQFVQFRKNNRKWVYRAAAITEALDPQKDFGDEDPFKYLT